MNALTIIWQFLYARRHRWALIAYTVCLYFDWTNHHLGWSLAYGLFLSYSLEPFFRSLR